MKILLVNKFLYPKGGADISFFETAKLLENQGHKVIFFSMRHPNNLSSPYSEYFVSKVDFNESGSTLAKIKAMGRIFYSFEAKRKIERLIEDEQPDIVHLNNIYHQISPSILDIFAKYKMPTVMTLHDYKLICPAYLMLARGKICEKCKEKKYYWCFLKKCTKNSYLKSLLNTLEMYLHHKILHIYDLIDIFISPSMFLKGKLKEMGFQKEIVYIPNFTDTKDYLPGHNSNEKTICYFGRLSREKGLFTLIDAVKGLDAILKIIGEGPLEESLELKVESEKVDNVEFLGYKKGEGLKEEIRKSMFVVLPSECYENNPRTVIEAFALGKPVIGSRIGGIPELVQDEKTGFTFEPGNAEDLRDKTKYLMSYPEKISEMGRNARKFVEKELNPEKHYKQLMKVYRLAMEKHK